MSDNNSLPLPKDPVFKTVLVVLITLAALAYLIFRPGPDGAENAKQEPSTGQTSPADSNTTGAAANPTRSAEEKNSSNKADPQVAADKKKSNDGELVKGASGSSSSTTGSNVGQDRESTSRTDSGTESRNRTQKSQGNATPRGPPESNSSKPVSRKSAKDYLKKISSDTFISPAGLIYGPGSTDRHRLTHLLKHSRDDLSKPVHGVFDGSEFQIVELVDLAYDRVKRKHSSVSSNSSGKRNVHTVYFAKRIGYVGGQTGKRKRNPSAKNVVLVLEKNRLITAYPK